MLQIVPFQKKTFHFDYRLLYRIHVRQVRFSAQVILISKREEFIFFLVSFSLFLICQYLVTQATGIPRSNSKIRIENGKTDNIILLFGCVS